MICKHCGKRLTKMTFTYYVEDGTLMAANNAAANHVWYGYANPAPYASASASYSWWQGNQYVQVPSQQFCMHQPVEEQQEEESQTDGG